MIGSTSDPVRLVGAPVRVTVPIDRRAAASIDTTLLPGEREHRAFLVLEDVDAQRNPETVYGVYVNLPSQPSDAELADHHVGNVSLFGIERARRPRRDEQAHRFRFSMEITEVLDRLAAAGTWTTGDRVDVTLQPIPLEPPADQPRELSGRAAVKTHADNPITIGRISVHYL
jgi:tyrosinase